MRGYNKAEYSPGKTALDTRLAREEREIGLQFEYLTAVQLLRREALHRLRGDSSSRRGRPQTMRQDHALDGHARVVDHQRPPQHLLV